MKTKDSILCLLILLAFYWLALAQPMPPAVIDTNLDYGPIPPFPAMASWSNVDAKASGGIIVMTNSATNYTESIPVTNQWRVWAYWGTNYVSISMTNAAGLIGIPDRTNMLAYERKFMETYPLYSTNIQFGYYRINYATNEITSGYGYLKIGANTWTTTNFR